jgi:hypothetical protein
MGDLARMQAPQAGSGPVGVCQLLSDIYDSY